MNEFHIFDLSNKKRWMIFHPDAYCFYCYDDFRASSLSLSSTRRIFADGVLVARQ